MKRKMLNEVLYCVYVISRFHCALGCVYIFHVYPSKHVLES